MRYESRFPVQPESALHQIARPLNPYFAIELGIPLLGLPLLATKIWAARLLNAVNPSAVFTAHEDLKKFDFFVCYSVNYCSLTFS